MTNPERVERTRHALREYHWDLIICALPMNVLLLSGYWPVIGAGLAIASSDGSIRLLVPEDEKDLAQDSWIDDVCTFKAGSLDRLATVAEAIEAPLRAFTKDFAGGPVRVGFEFGEVSEPASYAAMHLYSGTMRLLLEETFSNATLIAADEVLAHLRARKTAMEIGRLRTACEIAGKAFADGSNEIQVGASEVQVAAGFLEPLSTSLPHFPTVNRADGFAWCMSGANSALASGAYARSRPKRLDAGDLVLVHMNSYADGYTTDITRTYVLGDPEERQQQMYDAISLAREAALSAIRPGAKAAEVDAAARDVLQSRGFGPQFKHSSGHGVGFSAINAQAEPRLHPKSQDTLETGMVFNLEPAIYFEGYGGIRHCDMVAVTDRGAELLTPFQNPGSELLVSD